MAGKVLNISLNATITPLQKALESVGKMMNDFAASIEKTDKKMADSIRTNVADMNASLDKVKQSFVNTETAGDKAGKGGTASLRSQLRQATAEAQMLADTVGTTDPKFIAAASRAAELKDKIGDTQLAIDALNPDEKFKGIANLMGGITKAGAGLQGAMNAFGVESEDAAKAMAKLQGLMAMAEGFNALGGLVDVLGSIKTQVIAAAQSMGTLKFAIAATGIGALVIAVGLLATHWDEVSMALSDASLKTEMLADKQKKLAEDMDKAAEGEGNRVVDKFEKEQKYFNQAMDYKVREVQKQKELAEAKGASAKVIFDLDLKLIALEKERVLELAKRASTNLALHGEELKYKNEAIELDHQRQVVTAQYNKKLQEQADALKKVQAENAKLKADFQKNNPTIRPILPKDEIQRTYGEMLLKLRDFKPPTLASPKLTFSDDQLKRIELMKDSANALNDAFKNAAAEGISTFAFALGTALVEGGKGFDNMFQTILGIVAKASVALGNAFIAMGLASQKVKDSLFSDPYMAIAAGAALVVAGGVAQAVIKNMGAKKMEQGGLVYGNSFVNVGEYGNAHTNPEVIAPLSKLKDMIGGSNTQRVMVEGRLYGSQLAMASSRSQSVIKRVTGRR